MTEEILSARLEKIRKELNEASGGKYPVPRLIAVTKTRPAEDILLLEKLGISEIGENRVQELREKLPELEGHFRIHLIGRLQRNKVRYIAGSVDMIQSVDSVPLAEEISRRALEAERRIPILIEVNPAGEEQKGGVRPDEVRPLISVIRRLDGIRIRGLMAVMPLTEDTDLLRRLFTGMRELYEQLREEALPGTEIKELSMGMSGDYRLAAECGATMVRVGSAIFGPRN